jgi:hypothetical protein
MKALAEPVELLVVVRCRPVAVSVKTILAPDTVAPDGSLTLPLSWLADCAAAKEANNANAASRQTAHLAACTDRTLNSYHRSC